MNWLVSNQLSLWIVLIFFSRSHLSVFPAILGRWKCTYLLWKYLGFGCHCHSHFGHVSGLFVRLLDIQKMSENLIDTISSQLNIIWHEWLRQQPPLQRHLVHGLCGQNHGTQKVSFDQKFNLSLMGEGGGGFISHEANRQNNKQLFLFIVLN